MSAYDDIITWAKTLPNWQQLTIKHIFNGVEFDSTKINEVVDSALDDSKIEDNILDGLFYEGKKSPKVRLSGVSELNNINNLKDGGCLEFNEAGLTIIYGQNGSGKSGYSRIIKKCCRSRDKDTVILGNVHNPNNKNLEAKITYLVDDNKTEYVWGKIAVIPIELQLVHVFDKISGEVFSSKEADIQYKPFGMDILDRLVEVLPKIEEELKRRNNALQIIDLAPFFQNEYAETKAAELLINLDASNARSEYDALSQLDDAELNAVVSLQKNILEREASSPAKEREKLNKNNIALQSVKKYYSNLLTLLSKEKINIFNSKIRDITSATKNAEDAKLLTFDSNKFLAGTGNESWKTMWRAAEKFSKEYAYPGDEYPSETERVKCVLCQQVLNNEHACIMRQFGTYINDESQIILTRSQDAIKSEINDTKSILKNSNDEDTLIKTIEESYPNIYKSLMANITQIRKVILSIINSLEDTKTANGDDKNLTKYKQLETSINDILQRNKENLEKPLNDEEFISQLDRDKAKLKSLKARQLLKTYESEILNNIEHLPKREKIERIEKQCNTRNISIKMTELSTKYIIASLSACFNDELNKITDGKIEAILIPSGTKQGVPYSKIVLRRKDNGTHYEKINDVLSEGELRGISLAGFFAELTMTNNASAIVFDDPVSSLDHINARRIANRIVEEVKKRQIVVFTHDILFVAYIMERIPDKNLVSYKTVESLNQAGLVSPGLPFDKMTVKDRIGKLKNMIQNEIKPAYDNNCVPDYNRLAERFYKNLRMAWERAVEEILFGDVVKRYSHNVSTQQLRNVKYTPENAKIVEENMTICSSYLLHDPANGEEVNFGTPKEFEKNLKALEDFKKTNPK